MAPSHAAAQDADQLAQQLSNPISSLTSVPLQFNYHDGIGVGDDGSRTFLNVQPVIPMSIGEDWNLISRTIIPVVYQEGLFPGAGSQFGTGDVVQSLFFSPEALTASGWTWGVGPVLRLPTASDDLLGAEKWAAGPTAVALKQSSTGWTYGALVNHMWSFAGESSRDDISATFLQPFLSRGLGQGRTVSVSLESSYDWKDSQWTVPVSLFYSKVSSVGTQLVSYQLGVSYFAETPALGPEWGARFTVTLLFPR
ncbi:MULTISPECIES: transporter [unclassified Luteimonas]